MRKQVIDLLKASLEYEIKETSISPFELQKADELFLSNTIIGIQPITQYRKKKFDKKISEYLVDQLNAKLDHLVK